MDDPINAPVGLTARVPTRAANGAGRSACSIASGWPMVRLSDGKGRADASAGTDPARRSADNRMFSLLQDALHRDIQAAEKLHMSLRLNGLGPFVAPIALQSDHS